ncbi:bifunctional phosphopantothenoylcysteine decarboxylase/phosphopantothenate synthase [Trueperella sp. LYQ143]|uniref:bifunctional phosphopantothenoylcysteine decarboxylase/phosphopantothenate synthase n=1 Tax=Trueperella sp. LYQ143 TaxID=3391059 RepID=UPI0039837BEF
MRIVVGVCGGIAAYKTVAVVRALRAAGCEVQVVPTPNALEFVGKTTFEAISGHPVYVHTHEAADEVAHVRTGQNADMLLIAPATAHTIAKLACGLADNLLTATALIAPRIAIAPAMHTEMWLHPATQANIATLVARGVHIIGPETGRLTGADSGIGRMSEPSDIVAQALHILDLELAKADQVIAATPPHISQPGDCATPAAGSSRPLTASQTAATGLSFIISAGGTHEAIDPVRFIGNRSSGRMGVELANAAVRAGAQVRLVAAHIDSRVRRDIDPRIAVESVSSADDLHQVMRQQSSSADVVIMCAAVSDYRVASRSATKIKRGGSISLDLVPNPDILKDLVAHRRPQQTLVGFAAETGDEHTDFREYGRRKAQAKGADLLVINQVGENLGFGEGDTRVVIVDRHGEPRTELSGSKSEIAAAIITDIISYRKNS